MKISLKKFSLENRVAIITGGAGLLGAQHAEAIAEAGGIPILWDINAEASSEVAGKIARDYNISSSGIMVDITNQESIQKALDQVLDTVGRIDILINNAANDPKVKAGKNVEWSRFENYNLDRWNQDIAVGLTAAFLCSQVIGSFMAEQNNGVILNMASDLSIISPDQRLYRKAGLKDSEQPVKPITYSIVKHGIIGLTKYLATYWAEKNIRVNSISPGGVYTDQPDEFVEKLTNLIPLGRMADLDEYKSAVIFLISDASSYMTGANLVIDGGRTCW
jgi:NAD(P)-dependent dehydrogenase (short-subunit alcohol dehydrogenase family)